MFKRNIFTVKTLKFFSFIILLVFASCNSDDNGNNLSADLTPSKKSVENLSNLGSSNISIEKKVIKEGNIRF